MRILLLGILFLYIYCIINFYYFIKLSISLRKFKSQVRFTWKHHVFLYLKKKHLLCLIVFIFLCNKKSYKEIKKNLYAKNNVK
jgi:hypothetical protein